MSVSRHHRNTLLPVFVAGLSVALAACGPSNVPTPGQVQQPTPTMPQGPQVSALQKLDTAARTAKLASSKLCNLEFLDGEKFGGESMAIKNPAVTEFRGWIGDKATGKRPADARLRIATPNHYQAWESPVGAPVVRNDVAKFVNIPTLEDAGFQAKVDLTTLPQGEYRVYLVHGPTEAASICDNGRRISR